MVLSTENNYYTNIISPVMLLVTPISGLTVKISRFSLDPTIAYIHQHLFKIYYFQFEHCYNTSQNIHTPYPSFVCLVCFYSQSILQSDHFMALFSVQFSALHYFIFSVYTNLNFNRMFYSTFQIFLQIFNKEYYNLAFYSIFSTPAIFFEEMEPMLVIHNISIATDDDIIQFGNDVNIITESLNNHPGQLSFGEIA